MDSGTTAAGFSEFKTSKRPPSAGCPEHTYTESVHQCAQFAKGVLMTHFVHTFWGVYTLGAHFLGILQNFVRTFYGPLDTSCTLLFG